MTDRGDGRRAWLASLRGEWLFFLDPNALMTALPHFRRYEEFPGGSDGAMHQEVQIAAKRSSVLERPETSGGL